MTEIDMLKKISVINDLLIIVLLFECEW